MSSTLVLIFFTTIVFGGFIPYLIKHYKSKEEQEIKDYHLLNDKVESKIFQSTGTYDYDYSHPNNKLIE